MVEGIWEHKNTDRLLHRCSQPTQRALGISSSHHIQAIGKEEFGVKKFLYKCDCFTCMLLCRTILTYS
jgi:hypothetical protein